jgi:hypothetical protein
MNGNTEQSLSMQSPIFLGLSAILYDHWPFTLIGNVKNLTESGANSGARKSENTGLCPFP